MQKNTKTKKSKQPHLLFNKTQSILTKVERIVGHKILVYWNSYRGEVCENDVVALYEILKEFEAGEKIGIFIKSDGGDVEASLQIVNLIREHFPIVTSLVPLQCASAATMIALGADEIHMGPLAHLTAIDSSLIHDLSPLDRDNRRVSVSQDEIGRILALWNESSNSQQGNPYTDIFKYIHPLVIGAIDRSSSLSIKICREILSYHIKNEHEAERISKHLNSDYPSHTYPITAREAKNVGLQVFALDKEVNQLLLELNSLYSEMAQKALTYSDDFNYHDNEILNIHEAKNIQIYYQNDKDLNYIKEERRWQTLNNDSSWRKTEVINKKKIQSQLHIR